MKYKLRKEYSKNPEEALNEVAIAKERFNHTPVGIDLVAGRIEADLEACVYAKLDFVILNDVSSRILQRKYAFYNFCIYMCLKLNDFKILLYAYN